MHFSKPQSLILALPALLLLCVTDRANAASLSNYHERVSSAARSLEVMKNSYTSSEMWSEQQISVTIAQVRQALPAREEVTLNGTRVYVDNTWLHGGLDVYSRMNHADQQSGQALERIVERLKALDETLAEIESGKAAASADKDSNKARLAEILRRAEYNTKPAEEGNSALTRLLTRFLRWLLSLFPRTKPIQPGSALALSRIAQVVVISLSLIAIGFLIWKFAPSYLRGRRKKKVKREARIVLGERLEPDQSAADLLAQAEALARSGDVRAAIRKAYIALLCELGDRKVISLAQHKTNRDYLNAVRERASLYSAMKRLTQSFEIHWYGLYPAAESDWKDFRQVCRQALRLQ
jgi:Domain of unknown function (DUF4129)